MLWAVVVLLAVGLAWTAYDGTRLAIALRAAKADASVFKTALSERDAASAKSVADRLAADSTVARRRADTVPIRALAHLPLLGGDVRAVQTMTVALDETSREVVPVALKLVEATSGGGLRSADGRFDTARIARLAPLMGRLADASSRVDARVTGLRPATLRVPVVRKAAAQARDLLGALDSTAQAGRTAVRLLPTMMGQAGPRRYLLVVQNNAEVRATGGLIGSVAPVEVKDGRLVVGTQISDVKFPIRTRPVIPLTADENAVYGPTLGEDLRDTNITPDFPRTAELVQAMYRDTFGRSVDGVISVDPIALSMVLEATGPVRAGPETFTAQNVVPKLLHDVYQRYPSGPRQNAYFAAASKYIFGGISAGQGDERGLIKQVATAASHGRLLVWSAHAEEQKLLNGTTVGGSLNRRGERPDVGIYLDDATVAKMQYYLRYAGSVHSVSCSKTGQVIEAKMRLRSIAPKDMSGVVPYISGDGKYAPLGSMRLQVRFFSPVGGKITSILANGRAVKIASGSQGGRQVGLVVALLDAQQSIDFTVRFRSRPGADEDPVLRWTPGMTVQPNQATAYSSCR